MRTYIRSNVNPLNLPKLFFAGRACLTFRNTEKGTHMTVKVKQAKDKTDRKKKLPIFFVTVSLLGDSETGHIFAATIFRETMTIKLSPRAKETPQLSAVVGFIWNAIQKPEILNTRKVALLHEGRCCRCGLPLTHPESITSGLGPECIKSVLGSGVGLSAEELFIRI